MMTYLKNMGGYKHSQLKAKTFAEIQGLYERQKRVIDDFKPMDSDDAVKDSKEAAGVHKQKVLEEPNSTKVEVKQEGHEEKEEQLKAFLKIVSDEEGIIDYEVLEKRSDGSSRRIKTFFEMVTRFDRLDLEELYNLVMKRFETSTPEGVDLVLLGDLRTMFDANEKDELWQNQEGWNLKSWDLYENYGVHTLILEDGTKIHMLAERKYLLTKETLALKDCCIQDCESLDSWRFTLWDEGNLGQMEGGIDYDEIFAPMAKIEAIRIFLAFSSYMGFIVYQMDVKSAFLYDTIDEELYVSQPLGFVDPKFPNKVYKVVKALYGLHQAPRAWYATLSTFLLKSGYRRGTIKKTLFIKKDKNDIMLVQVYVDDIIFGSTKRSWCDEFEALMKSRFQMKSILKKFDFVSVKTASTPIETQKSLTKDEEAADVDVHLYRSMIGSLMYLTASRPDIMFAICACSRFQVTPKTSHLDVVKRIFRYLKGKPKLGLWYPRVSSFDLEAYTDSDYARAHLDRKSRQALLILGRWSLSWQCKKTDNCGHFTIEGKVLLVAATAVVKYCGYKIKLFSLQNKGNIEIRTPLHKGHALRKNLSGAKFTLWTM
ncbi:putative ribonuclease H-like domain-containing protein [Tanacetum coccineum]